MEAERNLQENSANSGTATDENGEKVLQREFVFYQVNDKITDSVKEELSKKDPGLKVSQETSLDIQYNQDNNAFELSTLKAAPGEETVAFVDPSATPVIADTNNETEVAKAVTTVVNGVLAKAAEFMTKRMDDLESVSGVRLNQTDSTNGTTTIYVDQPEDIGKLCANVDDKTLSCDTRALSSSAINLAAPEEGQKVEARPTIVVYIDM